MTINVGPPRKDDPAAQVVVNQDAALLASGTQAIVGAVGVPPVAAPNQFPTEMV